MNPSETNIAVFQFVELACNHFIFMHCLCAFSAFIHQKQGQKPEA